ncbi:MAG TPA: NlpC/P60 family protein [Thermoleophilia bacterium]|nr:NlpC/P60 family protein [Thermoleophilia bacterium]
MAGLQHRSLVLNAALGLALALACLAAPVALGKSYSDVPKSHWAHAAIESITARGPAGHHLMDDFGSLFKPEDPLTRAQFASALVTAAGHLTESVHTVAIADVPTTDPYYQVIEIALHHGYLGLQKDGSFYPNDAVVASQAEAGVVKWIKERYPTADWQLLTQLRTATWKPNTGWLTGAPSYLPYIVASRQLELRYNHPFAADKHEVTPGQPIDRAEVAYMFWRGYQLKNEWTLYGLSQYDAITFPPLSARQKEIARFALQFVGYPYVWAGEDPTKDSPYGYQAAGGFDCSGFVFYVMKMHFGYPITVSERGAHDMAARAKPRITRKNLTCGDLLFFGPNGPKSSVASIYHAALYLGNGWFIQSTGSTDGVSLASLDTSTYWKNAFAWGRRLLTPAELPPSPTPTPSPSPTPTSTPLTAQP